MREMIVRPFKRPSGVLGRLAGWLTTHLRPRARPRRACGVIPVIVDLRAWG